MFLYLSFTSIAQRKTQVSHLAIVSRGSESATTNICMYGGAACLNSGPFPPLLELCSNTEPLLVLATTPIRVPSSDTKVLGDGA